MAFLARLFLMAKTQSSRDYQPTLRESMEVRIVQERYNLAYMNQYPFFQDFDRYYKMYESYVNESKSIWQTKMFIPLVYSVIERFLPRIISSKPKVNFMARRPDTVDKSQKMQALFDWQMDQLSRLKDGGMYLEQLKYVKDALIMGTALVKVPWRLESRETKYYNQKNEVSQKLTKFFDGPDFEVIDPFDFFFDPEAYDIQRASWVIHRTRKTLDEMRAINASKGVEIYKNLDVLEHMEGDDLAANENDFKLRRKVALGSAQMLIRDDTTTKYELMECWGLFPKTDKNGEVLDTKEMENRVVVIANKNVCVRSIPFPYWHGKKPFIKYTPFPRTYEFYGIPIIKHLERIQFYTNEFVSQKFDNQVIELNQMIVVDPQANLEDWQLVWRPGGVIRANPSFVKPLPLGDVTGGFDSSLQYLSQVVQLTTGLSDYYSAGVNAEQTQNKTATGANDIEEQIATRVQEAVQVYEEQVIKELGYQWHGLDGQFIKLPCIVRVIGPDGKPDFPLVAPEDIRYEYDVIPEAGSTQPTNQALQRQQFVQVIQLLQSNPVMAQNTDWQQVEKRLWERFGEKDGNKMMTTTPGSAPQDMPGGQALPGGGAPQPQSGPGGGPLPQLPQGAQMPAQMSGQMLSQAMNGQGMGPQPGGAPMSQMQQGQPGSQTPGGATKLPGTISTKLDDLTLQEQAQWLQKLGIQPDLPSRVERFARGKDQQETDRALELLKQHQDMIPQ